MRLNEIATGAVGTALGVAGTVTQTNEVLETISLVITILGAVVSFIIVPFLSWHKKASQDGKITEDEIEEAAEILKKGAEDVKDTASDHKKRKGKNE